MRKHYFASKAGMVLPLLVLCVCAFGFVFAPNDPELVDLTKKFLAPCPEFPLGADNLGRCVLSRLLYGGGGARFFFSSHAADGEGRGGVWRRGRPYK